MIFLPNNFSGSNFTGHERKKNAFNHQKQPISYKTGSRTQLFLRLAPRYSFIESSQLIHIDDNDIRLAFELRFVRKQFAEIQPINTSNMSERTFIDTSFDRLADYFV